ncbi:MULTISPECIES: hypothetical protein [Nonomuraea]|uniref:Uncharacterized protein n=1 Tax=Nonomuraea mangrovi TaxID=2316207 RepID=A0ABW4SVG2_9ACTN
MALVVTGPRDSDEPTRAYRVPRPRTAGVGPRGVYREEALRGRAAARAAARRVPLVISGPSFALLWAVVALLVAAGVALTALALGTLGAGS